jgi:hypothetical protein
MELFSSFGKRTTLVFDVLDRCLAPDGGRSEQVFIESRWIFEEFMKDINDANWH